MKRGILLIDRGSKETNVKKELEDICKKLNHKKQYVFTDYCFLEVTSPYMDETIKKYALQNIDELIIIPYFLYFGKKIKMTVNNAMKFYAATNIKLKISRPMVMHKKIINIINNKIESAVSKNFKTILKKNIDVLIICHGSVEPNSHISIDYVVNNLRNEYRYVNYCFLEIEEPNIKNGFLKCIKNNPKLLVIVYYFLHKGTHVKIDIKKELDPLIKKYSSINVIITDHIGANGSIIELILERIKEIENANKKRSKYRR